MTTLMPLSDYRKQEKNALTFSKRQTTTEIGKSRKNPKIETIETTAMTYSQIDKARMSRVLFCVDFFEICIEKPMRNAINVFKIKKKMDALLNYPTIP